MRGGCSCVVAFSCDALGVVGGEVEVPEEDGMGVGEVEVSILTERGEVGEEEGGKGSEEGEGVGAGLGG
jgi:hypothetical protein